MVKPLNLVVVASLGLALSAVAIASQEVVVMPLTGAIGPASADFVERGLAARRARGRPAGRARRSTRPADSIRRCATSSRRSSRRACRSPPSWRPSGARAASAGTYILYASHVAAMAPGTNLGAATPGADRRTRSGGAGTFEAGRQGAKDKSEKAAPTMTAAARSGDARPQADARRRCLHSRTRANARTQSGLGRARGSRRGEPFRRGSARATRDRPHRRATCRTCCRSWTAARSSTATGERTLATAGAVVGRRLRRTGETRFLAVITEPSVALILMMIGIYGLFFEFSNPGFVLPGVVGAICAAASVSSRCICCRSTMPGSR